MDRSPVQKAAADIARRLDELGIDYAIAEALCLAAHGVVRATEDVDILMTREGLERFKSAWLGRGYIPRTTTDRCRAWWAPHLRRFCRLRPTSILMLS